jgi:hypothetical protein
MPGCRLGTATALFHPEQGRFHCCGCQWWTNKGITTKPVSPRHRAHQTISGSRLFTDASQATHGSFLSLHAIDFHDNLVKT